MAQHLAGPTREALSNKLGGPCYTGATLICVQRPSKQCPQGLQLRATPPSLASPGRHLRHLSMPPCKKLRYAHPSPRWSKHQTYLSVAAQAGPALGWRRLPSPNWHAAWSSPSSLRLHPLHRCPQAPWLVPLPLCFSVLLRCWSHASTIWPT
jgi:hypothetical protein